ncbi:hypothetical protein Cni_G00971 [Canna indica]|uniref:SWI/SNF complex subunit SWI3D n=1 Tax=Canna indica TaxID=4628 RepID=A0AAQ3PXJ2_9LILI|nr:hypothetical protein Cni_G00971 [Canna indica]
MEAKSRDASSAPASGEAAAAAAAPAPPPAAETLTEAPRRRAGGTKRKSSAPSSSTPAKRQAKERSLLHHVFPVHNGPCTRARQSPLKQGAAGAHKLADHAGATAWATAAGGKDPSSREGVIKEEEEEVVEEPLVDKEFEAVRSRGSNVHAVPTPAGWFSWKMIHPVEKHMLPSFFNGKSENRTPEVYMGIRNSIMKKFHSNPQTQVELKDFSELSVGDKDARQEVFDFLDHWGLINFHPFPPSEPEATKSDADDGDKTSLLVDKLYQFETIPPFPRFTPKKEEPLVPKAPPSLFPESSLADDLFKAGGSSVEYHCNSCSADCSRKRFHCQKQADFDLCTDCFNDGKFGSGMSRADFILMESGEGPGLSGGSWSDQETLLLLEALELFGENWNEIAEHVATKTKAQCILHFLQMPIEDSFLEGDDDANESNLSTKDQTPPNKESTTTNTTELMEVDKKEDKESSPKDVLEVETKKADSSDNVDEPITSKTDPLLNENTADNIAHEDAANFAIDALKAAFQAVGYFPERGLGSFAEAGNPVMALAAFLTGIVDSDAVMTSCRSSLKAMSEDSPSIQLATRHCFLLEDPPNDNKDPPVSVSTGIEAINKESQKDENKMQISDSADKSKEQKEISASLENDGNSSILLQDSPTKQIDERKVHDAAPPKAVPTTDQDSVDCSLSGEQPMDSNAKGATNVATDPMSTTMKETEDLSSHGEAAKDQAKEISGSKPVEETLNIMKNSDGLTSSDNVQQQTDSAKAVNKTDTSVILEGQVSMQTDGSTDETKEKSDDCERKDSRIDDEKNVNPAGVDGDHNIDRLKRSAVTALSAAAVKAKLLARMEEDEVRKLVSLIIEKQLHKLEVKLSLFTDIENVVLRMREQTEKARHRLMFERSQIIAARLGVSGSSLRANPASMPANRVAMGYGPTGPRPLNMATQKQPPLRRP